MTIKINASHLKELALAAESRAPWTTAKMGEYSKLVDADGLGMALDLLDKDAKYIAAANPAVILRLLEERSKMAEALRISCYCEQIQPDKCESCQTLAKWNGGEK